MTGPRINGSEIRSSKYALMLEAVEAMQVGDLLRWDLPEKSLASVRTRMSQMIPHKLWVHWHGERIWIVRYA